MTLNDLQIDQSWALFLDRDGVLNQRIIDGYVTRWDEFRWLPGVTEALKDLSEIFGTLIIVSNQQGVGKGIMTHEAVENIHINLMNDVTKKGGQIDAIYYSPHLSTEKSVSRKPNVGMGLKARKAFPSLRFNKSVMAGDSLSDMLFGKRLGMKTVFLSNDLKDLRQGHKLIDFAFPDLPAFSNALTLSPTHQSTNKARHAAPLHRIQ